MECYALEYLDGRLAPHGPSPAAEYPMKATCGVCLPGCGAAVGFGESCQHRMIDCCSPVQGSGDSQSLLFRSKGQSRGGCVKHSWADPLDTETCQAVTFGIPVCGGLGGGNQALTNQLQKCPAGGLSPLWSHPCGPAQNLVAPQLETVSWNFIQKRYQNYYFFQFRAIRNFIFPERRFNSVSQVRCIRGSHNLCQLST